MPDSPGFTPLAPLPIPAPLPARYANGRFGPGNPGRRAGARNRMSHRAAMAILEDFNAHKAKLLNEMRSFHREAYFAVLVRFLDRQMENEAPAVDDLSDDEMARRVDLVRAALDRPDTARNILLQLESALTSPLDVDPAASAHRDNGDQR